MITKEKIAAILSLDSWDAIIRGLKAYGLSYDRKGGGAVIKSGNEEIKASSVGKKFSLFHMEKRLGPLPPDASSALGNFDTTKIGPSWRGLENHAKITTARRNHILQAVRKKASLVLEDEDDEYFSNRFQWLVTEGRRALPDATVCEMWIKHKHLPNVECVGENDDLYRSPNEEIIGKYFVAYQEAIGADAFQVICSRQDKALRFHENMGYPEGIPAVILPGTFEELLAMNKRGETIAFKPLSKRWHYIFVRDVSVSAVEKMLASGISPTYIQEISPDLFQVLVKIPKLGEIAADKAIDVDVSRALNLMFGDCNPGSSQPHFAPGFINWCGFGKGDIMPIVTVVNAEGQCCNIADYGTWVLENRPAPIIGAFVPERSVKFVDGMTLYMAHLKDILRIKGQKFEEADHSSLDIMVATRLRGTGHGQDEVADILVNTGQKMRPKAHSNWVDYANRTVRKVFSDDKILLKYGKWIDTWREIEYACQPRRS